MRVPLLYHKLCKGVEMDIDLFRDKLIQRRVLEKDIKAGAKEFLVQALQELFANYSELKSLGWSQGQYYNDSEYYFRVNTENDELIVNGTQLHEFPEGEIPKWMQQAADDFENILDLFEWSDYEDVFGHNTVTITKDGITTEYFDTGC